MSAGAALGECQTVRDSLLEQIREANGRIAQLEDELFIERENTKKAYEQGRGDVSIISESPTTNVTGSAGGGDVIVPPANADEIAAVEAQGRATGYVIAGIVGVVAVVAWLVNKFWKRR